MQCCVTVAHSEGEAQVPPVEKLTIFINYRYRY